MLQFNFSNSIEFDFCKLFLYDNYAINTVNEGVLIDKYIAKDINTTLFNHFQNSPFVFISNRTNSYSVDPSIYMEAYTHLNMIGFCIVTKDHRTIENATVEKLFLKMDFNIFDNLNEAIHWADSISLKK